MCLKKILKPNNKGSDSRCSKSSATLKEKGKPAFPTTETDFIGLSGRIKYNMGGGLIGPIQPSLKRDREGNLTL